MGCIEEKNSIVEFKGNRITEDSIELCQEGIEHSAQSAVQGGETLV
jgi:hypothetical protein